MGTLFNDGRIGVSATGVYTDEVGGGCLDRCMGDGHDGEKFKGKMKKQCKSVPPHRLRFA